MLDLITSLYVEGFSNSFILKRVVFEFDLNYKENNIFFKINFHDLYENDNT